MIVEQKEPNDDFKFESSSYTKIQGNVASYGHELAESPKRASDKGELPTW